MMRQHPKYELFADMGDADEGVIGVKKTSVARAFPSVGHSMAFVFDYGDNWHFRLKLLGVGAKAAKTSRSARRGKPRRGSRAISGGG